MVETYNMSRDLPVKMPSELQQKIQIVDLHREIWATGVVISCCHHSGFLMPVHYRRTIIVDDDDYYYYSLFMTVLHAVIKGVRPVKYCCNKILRFLVGMMPASTVYLT